ncbi:uncharacterized protein DUF1761 [Tepidamorphus gemmatus]|uniref:Uncharacterized protein DUF1761 n=1 Tax=Tepidamorphus gemmatus TaxID=747076 RepID=A0A4R3ME76_9HYPH|nr:DUF1761 domain-containing protein [Tepidamorphus gemmatus]TCT11781.1 uncharacterized protein DUF1761 [Tepidamorphus gemmatus]
MTFTGINYLAVVVAAAVGFGAGAVWYRVFGTAWLAALGRNAQDVRPKPGPFVIAGIAQLLMAYMLAGVLGHMGSVTMQNGIVGAAFIWLGFVATTIVVSDSFQGAKPTLSVIDAGHWLVVLVLMGAVIGLFGV